MMHRAHPGKSVLILLDLDEILPSRICLVVQLAREKMWSALQIVPTQTDEVHRPLGI